MADDAQFKGEIRVHSRIVDYLSSGLYESPAASLKELINNAYDADATRVNMFVKPDANRIIIEDNGHGMDREEFERHFSVISESHKREDSETTAFGRPKIGKIGIGFIAANEICNVMDLTSKRTDSSELLEVSINFDLMRQDPVDRRRGDSGDLAKADYVGKVSKAESDKHFTTVILKDIRGEAQSILAGAGPSRFAAGELSLYGLHPESVLQMLGRSSLKTWSDFDAYSKTILEISLNVPVRYHEGWLPEDLADQVTDIQDEVSNLGFEVFIDGTEIRKPIVFKPAGPAFIRRFEFEGKHVSAEGYFYAQYKGISPQELQGLLIRIRHAAVGDHDPSFMGFSSSQGPLFQKWISGEIRADDRLEDALNIDRRTLRVSHPAYAELQVAIHEYLNKLMAEVRKEIYGSQSRARKVKRAQNIEERILEFASDEIERYSPEAADEVRSAWQNASQDKVGERSILRKFTVDELYSIVVEVAQDVLPRKQFHLFVKRLTEKLTD